MPRISVAQREETRKLGALKIASVEEGLALITEAVDQIEQGEKAPSTVYLRLSRGIVWMNGDDEVNVFQEDEAQAQLWRAMRWFAKHYSGRWALVAAKIVDLIESDVTADDARLLLASKVLPEELVNELVAFYEPDDDVREVIDEALETGTLRPEIQAFLEGATEDWDEDAEEPEAEDEEGLSAEVDAPEQPPQG